MQPPAAAPAPTPLLHSDGELRRQLATLALAEIAPSGSAEAVQAVTWWNLLARLGLQVPLVVVHDLGHLLAKGRGAVPRRLRAPSPGESLSGVRARYRGVLAAVAEAELVDTLGQGALLDQTIAVILARILRDVFLRWADRPLRAAASELSLGSGAYAQTRESLAQGANPSWVWPFVQRLADQERGIVARLEQIDASALQLLDLFSPEGASSSLPDLADLYQIVANVGSADVVDFSMHLLPSLLETKRRSAVQRFSVDGYASIERKGPIDALLPSELAHDEESFAVRALSDELLYYGRERAPEAAPRLSYVLVDASASMRGVRQVFARGLALALCKKLSLLGGEVWFRFFDSRLHDRLDVGRSARRDLPRLLTFRSERGRNYARVFADLLAEIDRVRRDDGREVAVTFITHGECHIPLETIDALARAAILYGVFVLPSRPITLDYLPRLHRHQVVTHETLARTASSRKRALDIVDDAAKMGAGGASRPTGARGPGRG